MNILITGGTGFIGQPLCKALEARHHKLWVLTRDPKKAHQNSPQKDPHFFKDLKEIEGQDFDAVINLAGEPIAKRWTKSYKFRLEKSRVELTHRLVETLGKSASPPRLLISGSAIGFYNAEATFSHQLCKKWEQAALEAKKWGCRVCCLRTGMVLAHHGGALSRMRLPFSLGLGGVLGTGKQIMSWIHLKDMVRVILFCLENGVEGAVNATAPFPVTNKEFTVLFGKLLRRPTFFHVPAFILKCLGGEMAKELLLSGEKILPTVLIERGFNFLYPELETALSMP